MTVLAQLLADANEVAAQTFDMNEAQKGGGGGRLLPEGFALARLVEYIEFGHHPQEYQGKAKDPALEFQLGFALFGTGYANEDGTPYIVRPYAMAMSRNDKARAYLTFKALNYKGTATHYAQLLNSTILVQIVHEPKSKTDATLVSRINLKGFRAPIDPVSQQYYTVPEAPPEMFRMFLWDKPNKAMWDAMFIDGKFDDGRSKNMLQEKCLSALNFPGSPLEQMLMGAGVMALPTTTVPAAVPAATAPQVAASPAGVPQSVPVPAAVPNPVAAEVAQPAQSAPSVVQPSPVTPTAIPTIPLPASAAPAAVPSSVNRSDVDDDIPY